MEHGLCYVVTELIGKSFSMGKFKDDATGNFYTQSLFLELSYHKPQNAIYTLKDEDYERDGKVYKSIKRLYLEIADPYEYEFANQCFANWRHWQRLCDSCGLLAPYIQEWREELEIKLRSEALTQVVKESKANSKGSLTAAKWLVDKGWVEKKGAGRPTKQAVDGERRKMASIKKEVQDDLARVRSVQH